MTIKISIEHWDNYDISPPQPWTTICVIANRSPGDAAGQWVYWVYNVPREYEEAAAAIVRSAWGRIEGGVFSPYASLLADNEARWGLEMLGREKGFEFR